MVIVHKALEPSAGCANAGRSRFVILALRPCVHSCSRKVVRAMLELDVHSVVVRVPVPVAVDVYVGEVDIRSTARIAAWSSLEVDVLAVDLRLAEGQAGSWYCVWLCDVVPVEQVNGVRADVVHLECRVVRQFALDARRPGLNVRVKRIVGLDDCDERKRRSGERSERRVGREHVVRKLRCRCIGRRVESIANAIWVDVGGIVDLTALC